MIKKKVLHIITATGVGGAENMLYKYLCNTNKDYIEHSVISLTGIDTFGVKIKELKIPVYSLSKPIYTLHGIKELLSLAQEKNPDVLQSWLYHSDLIALFLKLFLRAKLSWNIRSYKVLQYRLTTGILVRFLALFSKIPDSIIINSMASKEYHHKIWYRPSRWEYVPNGFDLSILKPREELDYDIRTELNIESNTKIIGMVARYSSEKDHESFLRACSLIHVQLPDVHFVMVGFGVDNSNMELVNIINELNLRDHIHLLGVRLDISKIVPCFDLACSTSIDEAFPNVIGEAMACAVPCVVTDTGDCGLLVGDTGKIVKTGDPKLISTACLDLLGLSRTELGELGFKARNRIMQKFSISKVSAKYDKIYLSL